MEHQAGGQSPKSSQAQPLQNQTGISTPDRSGPPTNPLAIVQRAVNTWDSLTPGEVMQLQRTIGNKAVGQLLKTQTIQSPSRSIANQGTGVIQRAIGMEIEVPVPIDQLSNAQVVQIQEEVALEQAAVNAHEKNMHKFNAKNIRDANGRVDYGTIRAAANGFRVDADHDDRVKTLPWNIPPGWPLPEGGNDSIMEIVMDPPAKDIPEFNAAMDHIAAFINDIKVNTNFLTGRWNHAFGNVSAGPLDYLDLPPVRQPHHNFQGSVQVNIGIDLREYHSLIKWYANSDYAKAGRAAEGDRALYRQIKEDIRQAVDIGRTITSNIYRGMTPIERGQAGNLRGLRGWITHLALYLKRGTIGLGVLGGTVKNIAPILLKSPNTVADHYGMTAAEHDYFTANRTDIMDQIFRQTGRGGDAGQPLDAVDAFAAIPGGPKADTLSDLASDAVALTGKPIMDTTGVGPARTGNAEVQALPTVPLNDPVSGRPTIGGGPNTRGGVVAEFRTLPGYYDGPDAWRALGLQFLQAAISRNSRNGIKP